jgi:hypothetical protein
MARGRRVRPQTDRAIAGYEADMQQSVLIWNQKDLPAYRRRAGVEDRNKA